MPDYKRISMSAERRDRVLAMARQIIECPDEQAAETAAHAALLTAVLRELAGDSLAADIAVLTRFDQVSEVSRVVFGTANVLQRQQHTGDVVFCFCPRNVQQRARSRSGCHRGGRETCEVTVRAPTPWTHAVYDDFEDSAHGRSYHATRLPIAMVEALRPLLDAWIAARTAHDLERKLILGALRTVVTHAKRFDQVVDAFPPAAELYEEFGGLLDLDDAARETLKGVKVRSKAPEVVSDSTPMPCPPPRPVGPPEPL